MSKRLLQLQCSILQIGDICMTLTRTPGKTQPHNGGVGKPRNYAIHPSPNSKVMATIKPAHVAIESNHMNQSSGRATNDVPLSPPVIALDDANETVTADPTPLSLALPRVSGVTVTTLETHDEPVNANGRKSRTPPFTSVSTSSPINLKRRRLSAHDPDEPTVDESKESRSSPPRIRRVDGTRPSTSPKPTVIKAAWASTLDEIAGYYCLFLLPEPDQSTNQRSIISLIRLARDLKGLGSWGVCRAEASDVFIWFSKSPAATTSTPFPSSTRFRFSF